MLREKLESYDFIVIEACIERRCVEIIEQHDVNLILLDLNLPGHQRCDFIQKVRAMTDAPMIVMSGEKSEAVKVESLEKGADDFICKPVNCNELKARIDAHLRRYAGLLEKNKVHLNEAANEDEVKFADYTLDRLKFELRDDDGQNMEMTQKEFLLLDFLIKNAGRALGRDELCEVLRERNYVPTPRSIDVKITRIRRKIGDNGAEPEIIKTVRGVGYIFDQEKLTTRNCMKGQSHA